MIAAVAWMVHSAPDSSRSIRRFRQARRSLAQQGGRRSRSAAQHAVDVDSASVIVMTPPRRHRSERVLDLRTDAGPGPARWPADGWSLGSEVASSPKVSWTTPAPDPYDVVAASAPVAPLALSGESRFAEEPQFAAAHPALRSPTPAPGREARPSRDESAPRPVAPVRPAAPARPEASSRPGTNDRPVAPEQHTSIRAARGLRPVPQASPRRAPLLAVEPQRPLGTPRTTPAHLRGSVPALPVSVAQFSPPSGSRQPSASRGPRPAATRQHRSQQFEAAMDRKLEHGRPNVVSMDDRPHHSAVAGGRPARRLQATPEVLRDSDDPARWRVVDLSEPQPAFAGAPRGAGRQPVAAARPTAYQVSQFGAPRPNTAVRPQAAQVRPQAALMRAQGGGGPRVEPGQRPRYRHVGDVTYVAVDRLGEPERSR